MSTLSDPVLVAEQERRVARFIERMEATDCVRHTNGRTAWTLRDVAQWVAQETLAGRSAAVPHNFNLTDEDADWVREHASRLCRMVG